MPDYTIQFVTGQHAIIEDATEDEVIEAFKLALYKGAPLEIIDNGTVLLVNPDHIVFITDKTASQKDELELETDEVIGEHDVS
jgi:hypothetical protein